MNTENSMFERLNSFIRNSVTLKLITITILMLLLLIPASMIKSIINEREALSSQVINEVSSKWADDQKITGPILTIPVKYFILKDNEQDIITQYWHILPENIDIDGKVSPEKLKRGIYEVVVYKSNLKFSGQFKINQQPEIDNIKKIEYDKAFITIGLTDLRGIKNQVSLTWQNTPHKVKPGSKIPGIIYSGITIDVPILAEEAGKTIDFDFSMTLQGSKSLSFVPVGAKTNVTLQSPWTTPSFDGKILPDTRKVNEKGFTASWSVLELNRNFPQNWTGTKYKSQLEMSSFGVNLLLAMDDYKKSYRSAKYAAMTIALTFLIFFLVEILNKRKIHPFQYALVGLALCLFYILLISISEHLTFNLAYAISTAAIVLMITLYSLSVFKKINLTLLLMTAVTAIYGFLFVTLQLADYALLMGSVGLTLMLGLTMYFTRNINWYKVDTKTE